MTLPTFEYMRRNAHRLLGDAEDELRSDWAPCPTGTPRVIGLPLRSAALPTRLGDSSKRAARDSGSDLGPPGAAKRMRATIWPTPADQQTHRD
jgi:hypothetical protein